LIELLKSIDWNQVWKEMRAQRTTVQRTASGWGKHAPNARRIIEDERYARDFFNIMKPQSDWTVLDMGCGPGTLALPLAPLVAHITAADFSQGMLDVVAEECRARGIANVTTKELAWEDDWQAAAAGTYDVIIASRSLVCDDLEEAVAKLDRAARQKVFISTIVGDGPFDRRVFEALGRSLNAGPDYMCNLNLLYQMGIFARVDFIQQDCRKYESPDEAFESLAWMIDKITEAENRRLKAFIDQHLIREQNHWVTDYERIVPWAVVWWEKEGPRCAG
jgi:SAM-dependent methyltransferase